MHVMFQQKGLVEGIQPTAVRAVGCMFPNVNPQLQLKIRGALSPCVRTQWLEQKYRCKWSTMPRSQLTGWAHMSMGKQDGGRAVITLYCQRMKRGRYTLCWGGEIVFGPLMGFSCLGGGKMDNDKTVTSSPSILVEQFLSFLFLLWLQYVNYSRADCTWGRLHSNSIIYTLSPINGKPNDVRSIMYIWSNTA
jgi:hypothetical protein